VEDFDAVKAGPGGQVNAILDGKSRIVKSNEITAGQAGGGTRMIRRSAGCDPDRAFFFTKQANGPR